MYDGDADEFPVVEVDIVNETCIVTIWYGKYHNRRCGIPLNVVDDVIDALEAEASDATE